MAGFLGVTMGAGSGGGPAALVRPGSSDESGVAWCGTGAGGISVATFATVAFNANYSQDWQNAAANAANPFDIMEPHLVVQFIGANAKDANLCVLSITPQGFVVGARTAQAGFINLAAVPASGLGIVWRMD